MVDAQAPVFLKAQHPVVPPRIAFLGLLEQAKGIVQAQPQQRLEVVALFGGVVNAFCEPHRVVAVAVFRRDVEVAHHQKLAPEPAGGAPGATGQPDPPEPGPESGGR